MNTWLTVGLKIFGAKSVVDFRNKLGDVRQNHHH
jgi:hypothetical protein